MRSGLCARTGGRAESRADVGADRAGGFTLIELLVVIAIIAILVSLLLPAIRRARESGYTVKCLSNQRQIGLGLTMYADTYKEFTPRESGFSQPPGVTDQRNYDPPWPFVLRPFVDGRVPIKSPWEDLRGGVGDLFSRSEYYRDPARRPDQHNIHYVNNGIAFRGPGQVNQFAKRPTPMHKYARPFDTLYLSCFTDDANRVHASGWYTAGTTDWAIARVYDMHHASNVIGGVSTQRGSQRIAANRHRSGANGVFLDGHAQLVPKNELTSLSRWDDGDYNPDGPPRNYP